jgi:phenylalanyl-tRNA synthetase beta subunit
MVFGQLLSAAKEAAGQILSDMWLQDIYQGDDGYAVTLRFAFLSTERTLTKQELAPSIEAITNAFAKLGIRVK